MTAKKLTLLLFFLHCCSIYAQTIKTGVVVIGSSAGGVAAAIQCARSKVKTILVWPGATVCSFSGKGIYTIHTNANVPSGIWGEFRNRVYDVYKKMPGYDTTQNTALKLDADTGASILKQMADTVKNLTVYLNAPFTGIKKDGDYWQVSITQNNKTVLIKARVVVDATAKGEVAEKAGVKITATLSNYTDSSETKNYRTSIAAIEPIAGPARAYYIPMGAVLLKNTDNLLITEILPDDKNIEYLPLQLQIGQGTAAVAAYCAFFKTTTKNLKVRIIQGELLDFKSYLLPFTDIGENNPDWRAIQQVCATGLLKGRQLSNGQFVFMPDTLVTTAQIKPVLTETYTRAFLWFNKEKPTEKFTIGNMLSFISDYTLTDPDALKLSLQKAWKTQYKFKLDFDMARQITRLEFAVLANKFLNPFARTVDLSGRLVN